MSVMELPHLSRSSTVTLIAALFSQHYLPFKVLFKELFKGLFTVLFTVLFSSAAAIFELVLPGLLSRHQFQMSNYSRVSTIDVVQLLRFLIRSH